MANYVYQNEPRMLGDMGFHAGINGAAIASSDMPWRIPALCRRAYRAWLATHPESGQDDWLALGTCTAPPKAAFVGVAITGGGNKSAVYSAEVMFELERYGLARHIDVLSSVSGGSFTAALYALSCDSNDGDQECRGLPGQWQRPVWDYASISKRIEANYLMPFLGRRARPDHLFLNAATHHGSADDMVDIVGGRLFQEQGKRLRFADLNSARPNLILNATNTTRDRAALDQDSGIPSERQRPLSDDDALHFAFTQQYFWRLLSELDSYPLADAVVASAAFPLLIDSQSLRVYRPEDLEAFAAGTPLRQPTYVSLLDGGIHDNFGVTELRWFIECQFDRNARRVAWTRDLRQRICGKPDLPRTPPSATLVLGINSSLLRRAGVRPDLPKPRGWDSYLGPLRLSGTAHSVDLIMAASGELRKMELRSLIEEVSRMHTAKHEPTSNPFRAPGPHQYVDIDLEAAYYMSCPGRVSADGMYAADQYPAGFGRDMPLNAANGTTERRRCEALIGVLRWNAPGGRGLALPTTPPGFCRGSECAALDDVLGDRRLGRAKVPDVADLFFPGPAGGARLLHNQALFDAVQNVPTSFELSARYVRLLRYVARWAVAHRVWELCTDHAELLDRLPGGRAPVCDKPLPARAIDDNPT